MTKNSPPNAGQRPKCRSHDAHVALRPLIRTFRWVGSLLNARTNTPTGDKTPPNHSARGISGVIASVSAGISPAFPRGLAGRIRASRRRIDGGRRDVGDYCGARRALMRALRVGRSYAAATRHSATRDSVSSDISLSPPPAKHTSNTNLTPRRGVALRRVRMCRITRRANSHPENAPISPCPSAAARATQAH